MLTIRLQTFYGDVYNFTARLQAPCSETTLWDGCKGFQILENLAVFESRTVNMVVKVQMTIVVLPQPAN